MNAFGELIARDAVRIERLLPGPIGRVWDYFIDADKRRLWIGGGVIEPFAGGRVEIFSRQRQTSPTRATRRRRNMPATTARAASSARSSPASRRTFSSISGSMAAANRRRSASNSRIAATRCC